jgi:hypothetical protein
VVLLISGNYFNFLLRNIISAIINIDDFAVCSKEKAG